MANSRSYADQTLCWDCQRAAGEIPMCSWAEKFIPVKGWDAILTFRSIGGHIEHSYTVIKCPKFVRDKPRKTMNCVLSETESEKFIKDPVSYIDSYSKI